MKVFLHVIIVQFSYVKGFSVIYHSHFTQRFVFANVVQIISNMLPSVSLKYKYLISAEVELSHYLIKICENFTLPFYTT